MHCSSFSRRAVARFFIIDSNDPSPNTALSLFFLVDVDVDLDAELELELDVDIGLDVVGCDGGGFPFCCCGVLLADAVNGDGIGDSVNGDIGAKSGLVCCECCEYCEYCDDVVLIVYCTSTVYL